jgi:hypothetical protein
VLIVLGTGIVFTGAYLGWLRRSGLTSGGVMRHAGESLSESQGRGGAINDRQMSTLRTLRPFGVAAIVLGLALAVLSALI